MKAISKLVTMSQSVKCLLLSICKSCILGIGMLSISLLITLPIVAISTEVTGNMSIAFLTWMGQN